MTDVIGSTPDDHFTAGPDCGVTVSAVRRIGRARGRPAICCRIISPACVQVVDTSAPDDHFTAGPHRRVDVSGIGRVGSAGGCPTIRAGSYLPPVLKVLLP